jgi:hypothetical protein
MLAIFYRMLTGDRPIAPSRPCGESSDGRPVRTTAIPKPDPRIATDAAPPRCGHGPGTAEIIDRRLAVDPERRLRTFRRCWTQDARACDIAAIDFGIHRPDVAAVGHGILWAAVMNVPCGF